MDRRYDSFEHQYMYERVCHYFILTFPSIIVFAPYKQNWIGIFSMVIAILATVVTKFPELLNQPVIPIPDL